jgi:exosortase E/protease (VPEID-CTERM system)
VNTPLSGIAVTPSRFGLVPRLVVIAVVASAEILLGSYLVQAVPLDALHGAPEALRLVQHWLFRFIIAYAVSLALLASLRGAGIGAALSAADRAAVRPRWALVHALLIVPFFYLSATLYTPTMPFAAMAVAWHLVAIAATLALFAVFAPAAIWIGVLRTTGGLPIFAVVPAAAAVAAIKLSQMLWVPAAELTFRFVNLILGPVLPGLQSDAATRILGTSRFAVQIAEVCSGLEGIGLMLAFCTAWLWFFRREYRFPRALVVIPIGVIAVFLLNALRIAVLILIGNAGYERVAVVGFHSQAGWIAFNLAAFGIAILAHTNPWLSRAAAERRTRRAQLAPTSEPSEAAHPQGAPRAADSNPTAAYLMPLLAILAAGMIARSLSGDFELWYPLRLAAACAALWIYRRAYTNLAFGFSWRGPVTGALVFAVWMASAAWLGTSADEPVGLTALSPGLRGAWIGCRLIAAVVTVPLAEELAYRGYLLRRITAVHFENTSFSAARWPALAVSAIAFGAVHGRFWIAGIVAGLAYGAVAMRTNKLGESVAAHATTNALIAAQVLLFRHWWLW